MLILASYASIITLVFIISKVQLYNAILVNATAARANTS